jgi:hypothetical protein
VQITERPSAAFTLSMTGDQGVSCTVYNQAVPSIPTSSLGVDKVWNVNGTSYADGNQPDGWSAGLTLDGADSEFTASYGGYEANPTVTIGENTQIALPLCIPGHRDTRTAC